MSWLERFIAKNLLGIALVCAALYTIVETLDGIDHRYAALRPLADIFSGSSSFLAGVVISFLFYYLVVVVPENRKRATIKLNFAFQYRLIKEEILTQVLFASQQGGRKDLVVNSETIAKLSSVAGFREIFEGGRESNEGFYAFRNHMSGDVPEFREILFSFKMLADQLDFIMHNYAVTDEDLFKLLGNLKHTFLYLDYAGPGYDQEKRLSKVIWEIFGGADLISGKRDYDLIEKMITEI